MQFSYRREIAGLSFSCKTLQFTCEIYVIFCFISAQVLARLSVLRSKAEISTSAAVQEAVVCT